MITPGLFASRDPTQRLILWGDGDHNDAPALEALAAGANDVVVMPGTAVVYPDRVLLGRRTFNIGDGVCLRGNQVREIIGAGPETVLRTHPDSENAAVTFLKDNGT